MTKDKMVLFGFGDDEVKLDLFSKHRIGKGKSMQGRFIKLRRTNDTSVTRFAVQQNLFYQLESIYIN